MSERSKRLLRRRIQARVMPVINIPMRVVLRRSSVTPLSGPLMLASLTGRKTGKAYRQPLSYMQQGKTLLTPSGGNWRPNLRDGQSVRIQLRGRDVLARSELVSGLDEIGRLWS